MEIKINDIVYTSVDAMEGRVPEAVVTFLQEWYNDAPYVMGHTSGSTGTPKPVQLLKSDMQASARLTNSYLGIDHDATLLLCLSPTYIAGKMMIVRALEVRAHLIVVEPSSTPLDAVSAPVTLAAMVPMQVAATLRRADGAERLSIVNQLLVGGAPVGDVLERQLLQLPTHIYATYGMTETVSHVALRRLGEIHYTAIGDVTFSTDERSCLVIVAPQLSGYRFVTNDVVQLIDNKHFVWKGRYDHVIMSGGLKFCAEEIERKISSVIATRYYITSAPDEVLGERVVLVIEGDAYREEELSALRENLARHLNRYEMPREIRFLPCFPTTYSGKVKRE